MFRLARYFSLTSLVTILIITALLAFLYRQLAIRDLLATGERHNVALTRALANALWPKFSPFLKSTENLGDDVLRNHPKTAEIRTFLGQAVKGLSVLKIKIYDMNGRTVFSSEAKQIGESKIKNAGFLSARSGVAASEITHRDKFSAFEEVIEDRDLISSYIPVRLDGAEGPIEGVFELYYDVTELMEKMAQTQKHVIAGVIVLLGLLYVVLFLIVRHAERVMQRQNDERILAEARLKVLRDINMAITSTLDLQQVLNLLMGRIDALVPHVAVGAAQVWLVNQNSRQLEPAASWNLTDELEKVGSPDDAVPALISEPLNSRQPAIALNLQTDPRSQQPEFYRRQGLVSYLGVPLLAQNNALGVITFLTQEEHAFSRQEIELLSALATQAALAIHNSQSFANSRNSERELAAANRSLEALLEEVQTAKETLENTNRRLDQQTVELQRSNAELEQFAYVASHDLQEPLRMITSYSQSLERDKTCQLSEDAKEDLYFIIDAAKRMRRLIDDLLTYSRIGTRGNPFQPADVNGVLKNSLNSLSLAIEESNAVITHDNLPTVHCDPGQIEQLLQNLIGNAIKYRNGQAPKVHVSCQHQDDAWLFRVQDNGIGIAPEFAERIFVIFQRLHTREEFPGTGIGLAVCKKIVERHDGKIWVESQPGNGSTFCFSIPQ